MYIYIVYYECENAVLMEYYILSQKNRAGYTVHVCMSPASMKHIAFRI